MTVTVGTVSGTGTYRQGERVGDAEARGVAGPERVEMQGLADAPAAVHLGREAVELRQAQLWRGRRVGGGDVELEVELVAHVVIVVPAGTGPVRAGGVALYFEPVLVVLLVELDVLRRRAVSWRQGGGGGGGVPDILHVGWGVGATGVDCDWTGLDWTGLNGIQYLDKGGELLAKAQRPLGGVVSGGGTHAHERESGDGGLGAGVHGGGAAGAASSAWEELSGGVQRMVQIC